MYGLSFCRCLLRFAHSLEPDNEAVNVKLKWSTDKRAKGEYTVPSVLAQVRSFAFDYSNNFSSALLNCFKVRHKLRFIGKDLQSLHEIQWFSFDESPRHENRRRNDGGLSPTQRPFLNRIVQVLDILQNLLCHVIVNWSVTFCQSDGSLDFWVYHASLK